MQSVPQLTLQSFFDAQLKDVWLGSVPASAPPPLVPSEQVPPAWQVHAVPLHAHEPVHSSGEVDAPEQEVTTTARSSGNAVLFSMALLTHRWVAFT